MGHTLALSAKRGSGTDTLLYNMSEERNEGKKERKEGEMGKEGNENGNKITWGKVIRREWTAQRESN